MGENAGESNMSELNSYVIRISFGNNVKEFGVVNGSMKISTATDIFCLSASGLEVKYKRAKKQKQDQAFNCTRLSRIKEIWLLYYSITGALPDVREVVFKFPGGTENISASEANLPACPVCSDQPIIGSEIAMGLYASASRLPMIASVSYLYASRKTHDVMSRFRYLWSSFNCLYKIYSHERSSEFLQARALLNAIPENKALARVKRSFQESAISLDSPSWRWNDFLRGFNALKVREPKNGEAFVSGNAETVLSDADEELLCVLMSRSAYSRWKKLPADKNPARHRLADLGNGACGNRFLFIFSSYLYWLRCDTMHGNSPYPVFMSKEQRTLLEVLCDSLETLIPHCLVFLCNQ